MHLAEMPDHHLQHPVSAGERLKAIVAREKYLLSLSASSKEANQVSVKSAGKYSKDVLKAGAAFLAVLAYCEKATEDPEDASVSTTAASGSSKAASNKRSHSDANGNGGGGGSRKKPRNSLIAGGTQVACLTGGEWILGHISRYVPESKKYEVLDDADDGEIHRIPRKHIRVLPIPSSSSRKSSTYSNANGHSNTNGEEFKDRQRVLAVYPQTTVFYPAALVKKSGKNWLVEFEDEDATAAGHKEVPVHYVMCE